MDGRLPELCCLLNRRRPRKAKEIRIFQEKNSSSRIRTTNNLLDNDCWPATFTVYCKNVFVPRRRIHPVLGHTLDREINMTQFAAER